MAGAMFLKWRDDVGSWQVVGPVLAVSWVRENSRVKVTFSLPNGETTTVDTLEAYLLNDEGSTMERLR